MKLLKRGSKTDLSLTFFIPVGTMPAAGLTAIATSLVFEPREDDIARSRVAVMVIAASADFSVQAVGKHCVFYGLRVVVVR
jgi:hypothetical protein